MIYASQASFNIETLEGAIRHMLQVCGCLSVESLDRFAENFAYERGKKLKENYAAKTVLPRMVRNRKIYSLVGNKYFTDRKSVV